MSAGASVASATPLRLIGRPPLLAGTLDVANDTDGNLWLGRHQPSLRSEGGGEIRESLRFVGRAMPNARTRVAVHLLVDPGTPPGLYRTEVDVGGTPQPVEVRVLERLGVSVLPCAVRLRAAAGENIQTDLVVSNDSNVDQVLPRHAVVFFEEANWVGRSLVFALRDAGADEGFQRYLDRVVRELRTTMASTTTLNLDAPVAALAPGAETVVRLSATLPAELIKGRTYVAFFTLASRPVHIEIAVNGAANSTKRRPT